MAWLGMRASGQAVKVGRSVSQLHINIEYDESSNILQ